MAYNDDHDVDPELALLPCPFCGKKAEYVPVNNLMTHVDEFYIRCTGCQIETFHMYNSKGLARKYWNRRVKI